ncbi:Patj homolog [Eumeta japonica]|uniref:Patj homolog n=1 Tax=Eumeta variegata TaxID=151549 RepID=A0A4C1XGM7_EUMVA|nr:Patj homolog [Eumeta japonica]
MSIDNVIEHDPGLRPFRDSILEEVPFLDRQDKAYEESTVIDTEESEVHHLPSPTSPEEIVIGADDGAEKAEVRRIQDKWREILENEKDWPGHHHGYDIVVGTIMKEPSTGLGISLEGTVRVVGGREVQARHYIRAVAPNGPVARTGLHRVGDELLEVNGWRVLGAHHVEVVSRLRAVASPVRLVCARMKNSENYRTQHARNVLGGSLQDLLAPPQRLIKAKSESSVASICSANTVLSAGHDHDEFCQEDLERNKSRSLEPLSGLAMWSDNVEFIQLQKEDRGLGFSILDYLDPSEPGSSVIVVRSVVRGGAAAADGRLAPGDRLVSVNGKDVARSPLAVAVKAIKCAPRVRGLGCAGADERKVDITGCDFESFSRFRYLNFRSVVISLIDSAIQTCSVATLWPIALALPMRGGVALGEWRRAYVVSGFGWNVESRIPSRIPSAYPIPFPKAWVLASGWSTRFRWRASSPAR